MNPVPLLSDWGGWLAVIGIEVFFWVVALAALQWRRRASGAASWHRMLWRGGLLGVLLIVAGEVVGMRPWLARSLERPNTAATQEVVARGNLEPTLDLATESMRLSPRRGAGAEVAQEPARARWWPACLWLTGTVLLLGRTVLARIAFWLALRKRGRPVEESLEQRGLRLSRALGFSRRVSFRAMDGLPGPLAFGVFRPVIAVPSGFSQENAPSAQDAMLAHELAHVAARDALWQALADAVVAVLWWHPVVWWMRGRLLAASELAADEACLIVADGPRVLAECLVTLARRWVSSPVGAGWQGMMGGRFRSALGQRVERLLGFEDSGAPAVPSWQRWTGRFGVLALLVGILALAALTLPDKPGRASMARLVFNEVWAADYPGSASAPAPAALAVDRIEWKPWSLEAIAAGLASGRPVLTLITADWSAVGRINEATALEVPAVRQRLRELGVLALRADVTQWTNPAAASELRDFRRLPLTIVYRGASRSVLPEALTPELVIEALNGSGVDLTATNTAGPSPAAVSEAEQQRSQQITAALFEGRRLYQAGSTAEARERLQAVLRDDPGNEAARHYLSLIDAGQRDRVALTNLSSSPGRPTIQARLDSLVLDSFGGTLPMSEMVQQLTSVARQVDPAKKGVNCILLSNVADVIIQIQPPLRNATLRQALTAIELGSGGLIESRVEDYAVVFHRPEPPKAKPAAALLTRMYQVDRDRVGRALLERLGAEVLPATPTGPAWIVNLLSYLRKQGVDFGSGKSGGGLPGLPPPVDAQRYLGLFDRDGELQPRVNPARLMVRATAAEQDIVETVLQELNTPPPQVVIEAKFVEVSPEAWKALALEWLPASQDGETAGASTFGWPTNSPAPKVTILTGQQSAAFGRALEKQRGANVLRVPKVTTLSGRQAQIKTVHVRSVVTHLELPADSAAGAGLAPSSEARGETPLPVTTMIETGPVLDVVPYVLQDGMTIRLTLIAAVKEFLGYDPAGSNEEPRPVMRLRSIVAPATLWDGQTAVLSMGDDRLEVVRGKNPRGQAEDSDGGIGKEFRQQHAEAKRKNQLVVLVTVCTIDPAGNRLHSDDEVPPGVPGVLGTRSEPPRTR